MAECEALVKCPFFNDKMEDMPRQADFFRDLYCRGNNKICARYLVLKALGREAVPPDLFPNHEPRARQIIKDSASKKPTKPTGGAR
jgi:hypothetical protein